MELSLSHLPQIVSPVTKSLTPLRIKATVVGKLGQEVTYNLPLPTNWEYTNGKPADQVKVENGIPFEQLSYRHLVNIQ